MTNYKLKSLPSDVEIHFKSESVGTLNMATFRISSKWMRDPRAKPLHEALSIAVDALEWRIDGVKSKANVPHVEATKLSTRSQI